MPSLFYIAEKLQQQQKIHLLKQDKELLLLQKKCLILKEILTNDKKKSKSILYLLSKTQKVEVNAQDNFNYKCINEFKRKRH